MVSLLLGTAPGGSHRLQRPVDLPVRLRGFRWPKLVVPAGTPIDSY